MKILAVKITTVLVIKRQRVHVGIGKLNKINMKRYLLFLVAVELLQLISATFVSVEDGHDSNERSSAIVLVFSAVENFELRQAIRETWGDKGILRTNHVAGPIFVISGMKGCDVESWNIQHTMTMEHRLHVEQKQHWDVLTFVKDDYRYKEDNINLAMEWINRQYDLGYFGRIKRHNLMIVKTTDDVYFDAATALEAFKQQNTTNSMFCDIVDNEPVIRDANSRFYVSKEIYSENNFQRHCFRSAWMFNGDSQRNLDCARAEVEPFPLEEIFFTDMAVRKAGMELVQMPDNQTSAVIDDKIENISHGVEKLCKIATQHLKQIFVHPVTPYDIQLYHRSILPTNQLN